jgi:rhodanese-related sulfurtransferase
VQPSYIVITGVAGIVLFTAFIYGQKDDDAWSADDLKRRIDNGDEIVILDVRTPREYTGEYGHIDGSILLPVQELAARIGEISAYRDSEIAVICRTDNRSRAAVSILRDAGFVNVQYVRGGMMQWHELYGGQ